MRRLLAFLLILLAGRAWALTGTAPITVQNGLVALTTPLTVANGGTGVATLTIHGVLMGQTAGAISASAAGTSGQAFLSGGAGADGAYGALNISTAAVTGTLAHGNGGTDLSAVTANAVIGNVTGANWAPITVTSCADTGGNHLNFTNGTGFSCGTSSPTAINSPIGFSSMMPLTTSQTCYVGIGTGIDCATEGNAQSIVNAHTFKNLRCINTAIQGTSNNIVITAMVGACGSQSAGSQTCTITGTTGANQSCSDLTNTAAPTAGQCIDWKIVTPATLTASAFVNCTVDVTA